MPDISSKPLPMSGRNVDISAIGSATAITVFFRKVYLDRGGCFIKSYIGGIEMNADEMKGKWKQVKGSVKEKWGKLTDDDMEVIDGNNRPDRGSLGFLDYF